MLNELLDEALIVVNISLWEMLEPREGISHWGL
jgi:hypothetical protein